jgi:GT2 family glycosyltransferase
MDISIIIVNWNTKDLLNNCLNSIRATISSIEYEIIVVDNASYDGSAALLREKWPHVIPIQNEENLGFGAANNQGFRIMNGRYALLLNTDTVLTEDAVNKLFTFMENHPDVAMACGQLLNADGSKQNSIANFPSLSSLLINASLLEYLLPKRFPSKRYHHKEPVEIDSGIGACLIIRRQAIEKVGMFDEQYFFFFEETDLAYRMRSAGWKIYHVPDAFIYHFQGQSIGHNVRSRIEFYRSRYHFFRKWRSKSYYNLVRIVLMLRLFVDWLLTSVAVILTLGMNKIINSKWIVYSRLLFLHLQIWDHRFWP